MTITPKLLLSSLALGITLHGFAQTDSTTGTDLHLGRVTVKKEFTQSITIKGADLERMPFASLQDALLAWSFGYFGANAQFTYVIDGIIINDVNVYSKFDIDEVVLVQNALGTLNGASGQQTLALIKLRKGGPRAAGFTVAGQSYQVKADTKLFDAPAGTESSSNYFHNYYVGGYFKAKAVQFGGSVNYLRDVSPYFKPMDPIPGTQTTVKPNNSDRISINGWMQAQLGRAHLLTFRINATPQFTGSTENRSTQNPVSAYSNDYRDRQTVINPTLTLQSRFAKGFTNELTASYATAKEKTDLEIASDGSLNTYTKNEQTVKASQVLIMDHITYRARLGKYWTLEPAANLFFRHINYDLKSGSITRYNGDLASVTENKIKLKGDAFFLTPSISLSYRNSLHLQAGLQANLSETHGAEINKVLPFATASIDVIRLARPDDPVSLQLFGSVGKSENTGDFALNLKNTIYLPGMGAITFQPTIFPFQRKGDLWNWQAGGRISVLDNLFSANYVFENRSYSTNMIIQSPGGPTLAAAELATKSHHVNLNAQVYNKGQLNWRTGINATTLRNEIKNLSFGSPSPGGTTKPKSTWSGGWTNRLAYKPFILGFDVLYYFNPQSNPMQTTSDRIDAISLSNIYVGYVFQLKDSRALECYLNMRNLFQDKDIKEFRSYEYYGLGIKATL